MTGERMIAFVRETAGLPRTEQVTIAPLGARGSDRTYFRATWSPARSAILVHYDPLRQENRYFVPIAQFLLQNGLPVPRIWGHRDDLCLALMDDLGTRDLWSERNRPWKERRRLYEKALRAVHRLHSLGERDIESAGVPLMEGFGPDLYRWERNYFMEHFVKHVCKTDLPGSMTEALEDELSQLAVRLASGKQSFVHRDFQSQNIMILDDDVVFIDFQGMRRGNPLYDIASLLCDPYVAFDDDTMADLLGVYTGLTGKTVTGGDNDASFDEAAVQRLMQALGAFGFLGLVKGLPRFLDHIPAAFRGLDRAASKIPSLHQLREVIDICRSSPWCGGTGCPGQAR